MDFQSSTCELAKAVSTLSRIVPARPVNRLWEYIRFTAEGEKVRLDVTDGMIYMSADVHAQVYEEGTVCLGGKLLNEIIKKQPGGETRMTVAGKKVVLKSDNAKSSIAVGEGDGYPDEPKFAKVSHIVSLPQAALKGCINGVEFACSNNELKKILCGVLLDVDNNVFHVVATDGYRMSVRRADCYASGDSFRIIIPRDGARELSSLLSDDPDGLVQLVTDGHRLSVKVGQYTLNIALTGGEFIDYKRLIPKDFQTQAKLDCKAFRGAVERSQIIAKASMGNLIQLHFAKNQVGVSAKAAMGETDEDVETEQTGEDIIIAFDVRLLMDALKQFDGEVQVGLNTPVSPVMIQEVGRYDSLHIILPVRVLSQEVSA